MWCDSHQHAFVWWTFVKLMVIMSYMANNSDGFIAILLQAVINQIMWPSDHVAFYCWSLLWPGNHHSSQLWSFGAVWCLMLRSFGSSTLMCSKKAFVHLICLTNVSSEGGVLLCDLPAKLHLSSSDDYQFHFRFWHLEQLVERQFQPAFVSVEGIISFSCVVVDGWTRVGPKGGYPRVGAQG